MMRRVFLLSFFMFLFLASKSQDDYNKIKESGLYYYGQSAVMEDYEKAEKKAGDLLLKNIIENIETNVIDMSLDDSSELIDKIMQTLESKIKSSSKMINVVNDAKNDEYSCFAYISKDNFNKICDERVADIQRYANIAMAKENEDNMVDALRSYYWAMMLCVAHPQGASVKINADGDTVDAYYYLYEKVVDAIGSFDFSVAKDNPGEFNEEGLAINLNVRTFGNDVSDLQIKYYNGRDNYYTTTVNNGKAHIQLLGNDVKELEIRIEYEFIHEVIAHPEVKKVLDNMDKIIIKKNVRKNIDLSPYFQFFAGDEPSNDTVAQDETDDDVVEAELDGNEQYFLEVMEEVENALRKKQYQDVKKYFTEEAFSMIDTLVRNGNVTILPDQQYDFLSYGNTTICHDMDMKFQFRNHASFLREVVFRFDNESKLITSFAFRLSNVAEHDISSKSKWPIDCKMALINFLEDYQTAYVLKRHDYLKQIYSDDALIIVGHVVKVNDQPMSDRRQFNLSENEIQLMQYDKDQYFKNLSRTFNTQEYINIRFTDTDFIRQQVPDENGVVKGEDIFGVRLLQEYHSTTYGDVGYLFLMVDLRDTKRPIIHVRAWQPDKVDINKLVGLDNLQ